MLTQLSSHNADSLLTHTHVPFCHSTWEKKCIFTLLLKFTTMHPLSKKIPCTLYFWSEYPFLKNACWDPTFSCVLHMILNLFHCHQSFKLAKKTHECLRDQIKLVHHLVSNLISTPVINRGLTQFSKLVVYSQPRIPSCQNHEWWKLCAILYSTSITKEDAR